MNRKLYAGSLFFALSFFLWLSLMPPVLGAIGTDDFFALVESGSTAEIETAIQGGQNLEQENIWGWTPLFVAVKRGDPEVVRLLLDASANLGHRTDENVTALHCALIAPAKGRPLEKMLEIITLLLLEDMSLANARNREGTTPLHIAALLYSDREILRQIQGDLKDVSRLLEVLLSAGANPNIKDDKEGNTALHEATLGRYEEVALLLIQSGADVNIANNEGVTPLCFASGMGLPKVVSALLERGANPNVRMEGVAGP